MMPIDHHIEQVRARLRELAKVAAQYADDVPSDLAEEITDTADELYGLERVQDRNNDLEHILAEYEERCAKYGHPYEHVDGDAERDQPPLPSPQRKPEDPLVKTLMRAVERQLADPAAREEICKLRYSEDNPPPPPETLVDWKVGRIRPAERCHADAWWAKALCLRRQRGARLVAEDEPIDWLFGYQRRSDAPVAIEDIIQAIEDEFPAWDRDMRIEELAAHVQEMQSQVRRAKQANSKEQLHDLIQKREAARTERDALIRERDGRPPAPAKAPRADLSKMTPDQKKAHKREQARLRMQRRRQRQQDDGEDVVTGVRERLGDVCLLCGAEEDLQLHHRHRSECEECFPSDEDAVTASQQRRKDPLRHYRIADTLDDDELEDHFALLCKGCHRDVTRGIVSLPAAKNREKQPVMDEWDAAEREAGW